ncbi:MAG TPA: hypothetical protein PKE39_01875 [Ignavibacteria bacterium]|nr:hypothetical protein [Ignavibacteria bacterium]HMQ97748.1 hypothetical protein [Ignavibacteria bacterium]
MKKTFLKHLGLFVIVAFVGIIINSCGDDTTTNNNTTPTYDAKSINGTVNFVETNFLDSSSGSYLIAAYPESGWPPMGGPTAFATIPVVNGTAAYNYKLTDLADGNYVISVGFRKNTGGQSPIMGIYGCDTSHSVSCLLNPTLKATITNSEGVGNITFMSWADTTNKIY